MVSDVKYSQFKLSKVKLLKGDGLEAKFYLMETLGDESFQNDTTRTSPRDVHPDLRSKLKSLNEIVLRIRSYDSFKLITGSKEFKATPAQVKAIEKTLLDIQQRISVTGISISGENAKKTVKITYTFEEDNKQIVGSATHGIFIENDNYGYEEEMREIVEDIEQEVFEYLFENKRAQQEIEFTKSID